MSAPRVIVGAPHPPSPASERGEFVPCSNRFGNAQEYIQS